MTYRLAVAISLAVCLAGLSPCRSAEPAATVAVITGLQDWLAEPLAERKPLAAQTWADAPLSKQQAEQVATLLTAERREQLQKERAAEMEGKQITLGKQQLRFEYRVFGKPPADGRRLFISLHGGGGAPARVNEQQWKNQQRLYEPKEGIYVSPRSPTNAWNMWHQGHIDPLFGRLIEDFVVLQDVDPNKVYVMGYSAGGDGVFQLAPRMADRWAAAAMMAGHPNETSPVGLRNTAFALHMGAKDGAYNRNKKAAEWKLLLAELRKNDPGGYDHYVKLHEGRGHWMNREDREAVPWMAAKRRRTDPKRIVWRQDDVTHRRFYWLAVGPDHAQGGAEVTAECDGQKIDLKANRPLQLAVRLSDRLVDLDKSVTITANGKTLHEGPVKRTAASIQQSLQERFDPDMVHYGQVVVELAPNETS